MSQIVKQYRTFLLLYTYHDLVASALQAYSFVRFVVHYLLPMTIFAYCYGRIFHTIRRQSQVVAGHASRSVAMATNNVSMATTSREEHPDQVQQQQTAAAAAETGNKLSRAELNVLQTMVVVITCFVICYTVGHIDNFLQLFGVRSFTRNRRQNLHVTGNRYVFW